MRAFNRLLLPLLLLTCISVPTALYPDNMSYASCHGTLHQAPEEIQVAYDQIVEAFSIYQTFLEADYQQNGTFRLTHASNPDQAYSFLACGFTKDMAQRICEAYTEWNPEHQELLLIPQDGLPVLDDKTRARVAFSQKGTDSIDFVCLFANCYAPGDIYRYSVTALLENGRWKIEDLSLESLLMENANNDAGICASCKS